MEENTNRSAALAVAALSNAGIEVIIDKDEMRRVLESVGEDLTFRIGNARRKEMTATLDKLRPDIEEGERKALFDYIDTLNDTKLEKVTFHWFAKGAVRLPEDMDKVRQAVDVAGKAKVDPMQYASPMVLLGAHADFKPSEKPINPNEVSTLHNRKDYGNGLVVYDVDDSEESRRNMREIINTHFGADCNPWCLLAGDRKGNLTEGSARMWEHYNKYPKRVAFQDGKLIAFFASNDVPTWWDRRDRSHKNGIPVTCKMPNDELGRTATYNYNEETGERSKPQDIHKGNRKNGLYQEWYDGGEQIKSECNYKDGKRDGEYRHWWDNGTLHEDCTYKDGSFDGAYKQWHFNGIPSVDCTYKDGCFDGECKEWYENGQIELETTFKDDEHVGEYKEWYENGQQKVEGTYNKDGVPNGGFKRWYESGQLMKEGNYKNGKLDGKYIEWYESGRRKIEANYKDDQLDGRYIKKGDNGKTLEDTHYKNGKKDGWSEEFDEEGRILSSAVYRDGVMVRNNLHDIELDLFDPLYAPIYHKSSQGDVYGFTYDEKIYLDPDMLDANTPVHEYTHLWDAAMRRSNPTLWQRGVELLKQTDLWQEVVNDPHYANIAGDDDKVASEVHARLSGAQGKAYFEKMAQEIEGEEDILIKSEKGYLMERLQQWLNAAMVWLRDIVFRKTEMSLDEFVNMPLQHLLNGVNPTLIEREEDKQKASNVEEPSIVAMSTDRRAVIDKYIERQDNVVTLYHDGEEYVIIDKEALPLRNIEGQSTSVDGQDRGCNRPLLAYRFPAAELEDVVDIISDMRKAVSFKDLPANKESPAITASSSKPTTAANEEENTTAEYHYMRR